MLCVCVYVCVIGLHQYYNKLVDVIMGADKSQDLHGELAGWRPRRVHGTDEIRRKSASEPPLLERLIFQFQSGLN